MENASKALIIAGAILISILLISVGIVIMNAISEPVASAGDTAASMGAETFNSKFDTFAGSKVDYNTAKQAITAVLSTASGERKIKMDASGSSAITSISDLDRTKKYKIVFKDQATASDVADGYYSLCTITPN